MGAFSPLNNLGLASVVPHQSKLNFDSCPLADDSAANEINRRRQGVFIALIRIFMPETRADDENEIGSWILSNARISEGETHSNISAMFAEPPCRRPDVNDKVMT